MKNFILISLWGVLFSFLICECITASPTAPLSDRKVKVTYDIPSSLSATDDLITYYKATTISSFGRSDEADASDAIMYTSLQVFTRAVYLMIVFAPMFLTSGLAFVFSAYRTIWFSLLRFGISQGGAAFIKWAQWASTRPDIFPAELCTVLSSLQSGAPEHSFSFTKKQIQKELGHPIDMIFEFFSKRPIASGSIAQVYKARLNGEDVAVKVRHPNVEQQIGIDFIIMKAVASLVDITPGLSWLKLSETMSQFSATIASQTDLSTEGRHLYLFNHFFKRWRGVSFPSPIILTNSILVETFEFGDSVDKYARNLRCKVEDSILENLGEFKGTDSKINKAEKFAKILKDCDLAHFIVTTGEDTYLKMLLQDNLMHADLHPGNILIQDEKKTRIVLVDAGMVARLLPKEQKNFIGLLEAMGEGRGDEAADHIMQFTSKPEYNLDTKKSFRKDMKEMFSISCKGYGKNVDIGVALREILNLVRVHKITIDANYATLIMNALCLDGMAMSLLPSYNILDGAKPLLRFNRLFKRIPGSFLFLKAVIPVAQALKRRSDKIFLISLKEELKN